MGRSSYTSNTVNYLSHAQYASSGSRCPYSATWHAAGAGAEDAHNKSTSSTIISSSNNLASTSSARPKDTPTVWAVNAFDPDDEALPSIDERFLEPYEDAEGGIHFLDAAQQDREFTSDDEDEDDDDDEDAAMHADRWGGDDLDEGESYYEGDEEGDEAMLQDLTSTSIHTLPAHAASDAYGALLRTNARRDARQREALALSLPGDAQVAPVTRYTGSGAGVEREDRSGTMSAEEFNWYLQNLAPAGRSVRSTEVPASTARTRASHNDGTLDECLDAAPATAAEAAREYDEPPHGNGGYYDFDYSREEEEGDQVIDRRSTPSVVDDFSPSAGVFHRHTLPFSLPNMGEVQLQRRTSGNGHSNSNSNVTVLSAMY